MAYQRGSGRVGRLRHSELSETARAAHFARSIGRHGDKVVECSRDALLIGAKLCVLPDPSPELWRPCLERHLKLQIQDTVLVRRADAPSEDSEQKIVFHLLTHFWNADDEAEMFVFYPLNSVACQ